MLWLKKKKSLKNTAKSQNRKNNTTLSKEQIRQIQNRMSLLKSKNTNNKSATQNSIPYIEMFKDGVCYVSKDLFSRTIEFYDTDYETETFEDKENIFKRWSDIINYFDERIDFQFTYENQIVNIENEIRKIEIFAQNDKFNAVRKEYSDMLCRQKKESNSGFVLRKFLTFTIKEKSLKTARKILNSIAEDVTELFTDLGVPSTILNGKQRLEVLYHSLNPFSDDKFIFDWNLKKQGGYSTKDFIAPMSLKFKKNNFEINDGFGSITSVDILAGELSDRILTDLLNCGNQISINMHIKSFDQLKALKLIRGKLSDVEKMKIDEQKKASMSGYDPDILPQQIKTYINELNTILEDLNSKNERLFNITLTVRSYNQSEEKAKLELESLKRLVQQKSCKLFTLDYMQEQGFQSFLPLGINSIPITRTLPTSPVAVFIPFTSQSLYQANGCYYGINPLTGDMIIADRKNLKNPNGLILGTPGSGKSFAVKREIIDRFLKTQSDIIITDPEGEYFPLVNYLDGQVIKISSNSTQYINPMDINIDSTERMEDRIADKSNFLVSLCELIVGDNGLRAEEKSIVDEATKIIYQKFFENPDISKMPTLSDLLKVLKNKGAIAKRLANSLEMYVNGTQNIFNHSTNVDIENRIVCYDIKELSSQIKKIAMLIIQEQVWNRVSVNREQSKSTLYYIDEFHLLLRDEQTAKYSMEMWKRFRKWGGVPTGITQNVKDLLTSPEIENILDNSDFIYMLNQSAGDRNILKEKLHISDSQIKYVTDSGQGKGLIRYGKIILPFEDKFPTDTVMYSLITTKPEERNLLEQKLAQLQS